MTRSVSAREKMIDRAAHVVAERVNLYPHTWPRDASTDPRCREIAAAVIDAVAAPDLYEALDDAADQLAILSGSTSSYCEVCDHHAPKDPHGRITGSVEHADDCALGRARAALAKARGEG